MEEASKDYNLGPDSLTLDWEHQSELLANFVEHTQYLNAHTMRAHHAKAAEQSSDDQALATIHFV
tara:strand:- start:158 stop:352 length:195 start_codon:yes stop_codon:yes gene_type:complete